MEKVAGETPALLYQLGNGGAEFLGLESERTGLAFVGDAAVGVDEVQAVGPGGVGLLRCVTEFVEDGGELDAELAHAGSGDEAAFVFILRAGEDDLILDVALHLPDVAGMGFEDVDHQEGDLAVVVVIQLVQSGNLPPKRWSSIAAEHEHNGLLRVEARELDAGAFVELEEIEIGSGIAETEFAGARVGPCGLKGEEEKGSGAWHVRHDAGEFLGRLLHGPTDQAGEGEVEHEQSNDGASQPGFLGSAHPHGSDMVVDSWWGRL